MMTIAAFVSAWLLAHGFSNPQTNAVMHYIETESGFEPCVESGRGHYLMQWVGARRRQLQAWSGSYGCPSLERQLQFATWEIRTKFWCVLEASNPYPVMRRTFGRGGSC